MKHLKKLISLSLALLMTFCLVNLPLDVQAADSNAGHFYVTAEGTDAAWNYDTGTISITGDGTYTITKNCDCTDAHSGYQIYVAENVIATITITDVQITNSNTSAMCIDGTSKVTLVLEGDNSFTSSDGSAGVYFPDANTYGGSLEITSYTNGTLTAQGGGYGAGIGGGFWENGTNITISGGTVTAIGGDYAAGIGGGLQGTGTYITISGGTVTATGDSGAAGIGDGDSAWGATTDIVISGGSVKASRISTTPQNEDDEYVYLATIADAAGVNSVTVDGTNYNISDNHPDDNTLYLYLTGEDHEVIVNTSIYSVTWNESSLSFTVTYVGEVETSTDSGTIIVDTSTR